MNWYQQVIETNGERGCVSLRDEEEPEKVTQCTFDRVLGPESSQEDVFLEITPALETVVEGFNACILAYGHTGSGKTHTLIGPGGGTSLAHERIEWGVIPRAVEFLFGRLADASEGDETFAYSVSCSFLQIYNENLVDLLQDGGSSRRSLQIREERARRRETGDKSPWKRSNRTTALYENRRVFVNGLSSFRVGGAEDVLRYISIGAANRRVRATKHNEASSRSHAVLQIVVEAESGGCNATASGPPGGGVRSDGNVTYRQAKLSLVDLAGSEKMDSMLNTSRGHFNELRSINQSLSALGNVVSALAEKGRVHIPYRDSKLTRLLQDSLGGNTRTTIIACISPLAEHANETMSTLHFADRARRIMVRLRPNEVVDDRVLLERAKAEIVRLKKLLRQALDKTLRDTDADAHEELAEINASDAKLDIRTTRPRLGMTQEHTETTEETSQGQLPPGFGEQISGFAAQELARVSPSTRETRARTTLMVEIERLREENERLRVDIDHFLHEKQQRRRRRMRTTNRRPYSSPRRWSTARQIPGSPSGRHTPSLAPAAASTFERRRFDEDDTDHGGSEDLNDPPFTADELRDILGEETSPREEEERQEELETATELQVFRSRLNRLTGEAPAMLHPETGGDVTGGPGAIREFQQLEDQMFAAQGRQKRLMCLEKARFRAAQKERIALEAELKALTSETSSTAPNLSQSRESLSPPYLSPLKDDGDGDGDGDGDAPGDVPQNSDTSLENHTTREANGSTGNGVYVNCKWARFSERIGSRGKARSPRHGEMIRHDLESGRRGSTPGSSKAIPRAMTPLTRRPQRSQIRQMGWTTPSRRSASRRRPASSVRAYGRASSWLSRAKPEARSPVRGEPTFEVPAQGEIMSPDQKKQDASSSADFNEDMTPQEVIRGEGANSKRMTSRNNRTRYPRGTQSIVSGRHRKLQEGDRESEDTGEEREGGKGVTEGQEGESTLLDAETPKPRLRYGVADLGLRLRVYSFRYDHHYECQIVGYDSRRRMHRCAYDVTGEKQWHDLKTKRFEIVGRNGVLVRSSESAPTAIRPSRF